MACPSSGRHNRISCEFQLTTRKDTPPFSFLQSSTFGNNSVWAFLTYFIGTKFLPEPQTRADHRELLRTIGFSSAPGLIRVLGIIPGLRALLFLVAGIWMLVAMVIAVRQALDYTSTWRAIGVCVIGWVVQLLILTVALSMVGAL